MILVHELGHFLAAIAVGIKVETFSLGFGPRLFGFKHGDTDFRVSAVLFGGYVKMFGDQPGEETANDPRAFLAKPRWQRAVVVFAGPFMNIVLALAIVAGLYMHGFAREVETPDPVISGVQPDSPAAQAGMQAGDKIIEIDNHKNPTWSDVLTEEALNANHAIPVVVERRGNKLHLMVTPRMDPKEGIGYAGWSGQQDVRVGEVAKASPAAAAGLKPNDLFIKVNGRPVVSPVTVQQAVIHSRGKPIQITIMRNGRPETLSIAPAPTNDPKMPWRIGILFKLPAQEVKLGFPQAIVESARTNAQNATLMYQVLKGIVERRVSPKQLTSPIGIAQMSSEAAHQGAANFLGLMAIISLNLAIVNLLPIPILDGAALLMLVIEMLLQREVSMQVKETAFKLGFVFLMMIVVFAIYNDITRILTNS